MAYVRGSERRFRGMRGFDPRRGPRSPFGADPTSEDWFKTGALLDPAKAAAYAQKYASVEAAQKAAVATVKNLASNSDYGPVLAAALSGASNPSALGAAAKAFAASKAAQFPNKMDQDALRLFYSQARAAADVLDDYVSINPVAKEVAKYVDAGSGLFGEYQNLVGKLATAGKLDAAGITDAADLVRRTVTYVGGLVTRAAGKNSDAAKIASEITDWTGIATGCAVSMAATGPTPAGAFGCAVAVLGKLFTMLDDAFSGIKLAVPDPAVQQLPMAVFTPNTQQMPLVAADAVRLAALLRYRYGVASYAAFKAPGLFYGNKALFDSYPANGSGKVPYGYTPQDLVFALQKFFGTGSGDYSRAFRWGALYRESTTGKKFNRADFEVWGDLDLDATYWAADIARKLGAKLTTTEKVTPATGASYPAVEARSFRIPLIYTELVNFFAAATLYEAQTNTAALKPLLFGELPIRFWYCGKSTSVSTSWPTDPRQEMSRYDSYLWSMMEDCAPTLFAPQHLGNIVLDSSHPGHECALRSIGHIRLLAALSYIHMMSQWGTSDNLYPGRDMIADLDTLTPTTPGYVLRLPVDPRTVNGVTPSPKQLYNTTAAAAAKMAALQKAATTAATATVSSDVLAAFKAPTTTAAGPLVAADPLQQAIKSGALQVQYTPAWATPSSASADGSGGAVAVLGGAALLALLLLK